MLIMGHVMFGTPPTKEITKLVKKIGLDDFKEFVNRSTGWYEEYSSDNRHPAFYFWVKIAELDTHSGFSTVNLADWQQKVAAAQQQYNTLLSGFMAEMEQLEAADYEPLGIDWTVMLELLKSPTVNIVWL